MFYVYVYSFDGIPRYVGKGKGDRWKKHRRLKTILGNKLRSIYTVSNEWVMPTIMFANSEIDAFAEEMRLIREYGRMDLATGNLWNLTEGGDGTAGHKVSETTRQKISNAFKDPKLKATHSEATRQGMGPKKVKVIRPKKGSAECNAKISERTKAAMTLSVREKISKRTRSALENRYITKVFTESHRRNLSKSHMKLSDLQIQHIFYDTRKHKEIALAYAMSISHVGCIKRLGRQVYRDIILGE